MLSWCKTADGWAVNLDGTSAAAGFSLPRIELHSGPRGWTCVCHRENGTSVHLQFRGATSAPAAKRVAAEEGLLAVGAAYEAGLRALLASAAA